MSPDPVLLPALSPIVNQLINEFDQIPPERKEQLHTLTQFVKNNESASKQVLLNFICTHNSRRSHLAQIWAQTAAHQFGVSNVVCFSGGTEATAFNPRAVKAMQEAGFNILLFKDGENPKYKVQYADNIKPLVVFSKKYDDPFNPRKDFAAIMTCSHADENCPYVFGAASRIVLTYDDPKNFDNTPQEAAKYAERVREIGREMLFVFSRVKML